MSETKSYELLKRIYDEIGEEHQEALCLAMMRIINKETEG